MRKGSRQELFGRRSLPHTIVIARGEKVRHWTVRPWIALGLGGCGLAALLGATGLGTILLMGGPVLDAVQTRDSHTAAAYEERIADLRRQLDRLTTRQATEQNTVARQVQDLLAQQAQLSERFKRLGPLLLQARDAGLVPSEAPADAGTLLRKTEIETGGDAADRRAAISQGDAGSVSQLAHAVLPTIRQSVDFYAEQQETRIANLTRDADTKADRIADLLGSIGIDAPDETAPVGGPFVDADPIDSFSQSLDDLQQSLDLLDRLRRRTDRLPLGDPLPGARVTSPFGARLDPFFREAAIHTGMDFAATTGVAVRPTAPGKIVSAGFAGGYGLMVEIDHGDGLSTRYGHLSRIAVAVGDEVTTRSVVGAVGSTGRSTGPHLHYEVRLHDEAVNPDRWIKAGRRLAAL